MTSAIELAQQISAGEVRAVEVVQDALDRIDERNDELVAFVYVDAEGALSEARRVDEARRNGDQLGPLAGVPFGVKDLEDCAGMPTRHGSLLFADAPPASDDSLSVARLRAAGAIPLGKTAASEFGFDGVTSTRIGGTTRNPWNPVMTPGGSSGGSAAAVAAGMVTFATGTDGAGSIRAPASFTGLVGMKTTHGMIPAEEVSDWTQRGVLTNSVAEHAAILAVMAGRHSRDRTSWGATSQPFKVDLGAPLRPGLRAGWSTDLGYAVVESAVAEISREASRYLAAAAGMEWVDIEFSPGPVLRTWVEIAAFQSYGKFVHRDLWPKCRADLCVTTLRSFDRGSKLTVGDYARARADRARIEAETASLFEEIDVLFTPSVSVSCMPAEGPLPTVIEGKDASLGGAEPFGALANLTWRPSISVPAGLSPDGMPIGLQMTGRHADDGLLLQLASILERARPWPRLPSLGVAT